MQGVLFFQQIGRRTGDGDFCARGNQCRITLAGSFLQNIAAAQDHIFTALPCRRVGVP